MNDADAGGGTAPKADGSGTESAELFCRPDGRIEAIYTETIELDQLGPTVIRRASHVEPDPAGRWWADLSPSGGGQLGPFACRSAALAAEREWLVGRLSTSCGRVAN